MREREKRTLLDRWREIEDDDGSPTGSPAEDLEFRSLKEQWFSDAFRFLIKLPEEIHIWCGYGDVMWPLLEPFGSYFQYKQADMPLKVLWKRICAELRQCFQCCFQHHKAQESYKSEFEEDIVKPLLTVLQTLDEERVAEHLRDINSREKLTGLYAKEDFAEIVSVLFEVLMFPDLLDDQAIANEFVPFILEVEKSHDLTLTRSQQYPGVYALLFLQKTEVRAIGFRLAGILGEIRETSRLEPVQPLLKKFIHFLNNSPPNKEISRPRIQYDRASVWLGIKSLIGFLNPQEFEEGIIERYPIFLSIVLNHVSDDSTKDFAHAVDILKLLFEILGCKLWLKTTFSPSVMRNTLLGQCFHTRIERHHKAIFDLFQPFLQSLEALQDGEYERQRRHFLYFLLHQVSHSSNFSVLMKKKACQIAIFIVGRGYKMDPPCPPFECAHMWGPSLIHSVRDASLYTALRQPAFDLIQTIIVADAAALTSLWARQCNRHISFAKLPSEIDDDDDESQSMNEIEEADLNCWTDFNMLSKLASKDCVEWFCIPLLWVEVLMKGAPSSLPLSFSKSVMWALSRISAIEPDISNLVKMPVLEWISVHFAKFDASFIWDIPKGCDDGADGKGCTNSIKAAPHCVNLLRLIRRCAACYARQIEESELRMQWTWEPRMCETIILLFVDPHDVVRTAGKVILEQVSGTRGVVSGLQFLCSSQGSISAMSLGLRYAIKMLLGNSIPSTSQILQHLFFIVSKLVDPSMIMMGDSSNERNVKAAEKFCQLLSENIWPLLLKCLTEGKCLVQDKAYQMTFVRLLEILPLIVEHMSSSLFKQSSFCEVEGDSSVTMTETVDFKWFNDLLDWGKSQLKVIQSHWKKAVGGILNIFKDLTYGASHTVINTIKGILESDNLMVCQLQEQVSLLSILMRENNASLSQRQSERRTVHNQALVSGEQNHFHKVQDTVYGDSFDKDGVTELSKGKNEHEIIILSDDEIETERESRAPSQSHAHARGGFRKPLSLEIEKTIQADEKSHYSLSNQDSCSNSTESFSLATSSSKICPIGTTMGSSNSGIKEPPFTCEYFDNRGSILPQPGDLILNVPVSTLHPAVAKHNLSSLPTVGNEKHVSSQKIQESIKESSKSKILNRTGDATNVGTRLESHGIGDQKYDAENIARISSVHKPSTVCNSSDDLLLKEMVSGSQDDPLEAALDAARNVPTLLPKPPAPPKRQLIHLQVPFENDKGRFDRLQGGMKKYKPPRLDDWYKRILELNYFSIVGISLPGSETEYLQAINLTEVPTSFLSPDHYMDVFRPLVLEEFKAQLRHSFEEVSSPEDMCFGNLNLLSLEKVDDFHLGRFMPDAGEDAVASGCSENDLVLLSRKPFQTVSENLHMIGKVERRERDAKSRSTILLLRLYLHSGIPRLAKARRHLTVRSKWCVTRLMSITPQLREFQALSAVKDVPLLPVILNPHRAATEFADVCNQTQGGDMKLFPKPLKECLKEAFNESQFKAINAVLERNGSQKNCGLSLIQGPPGTGKTKTILAIVSVLLAISKISNKSSGGIARDNVCRQQIASSSLSRGKLKMSQSAATARSWQDAGHARQLMKHNNKSAYKPFELEGPRTSRVLVCAQSNAAVDELVSRICNHGLHDITGQKYKPYIVRVGNAKTVHPDSLPVFIDTLVEQRLGEKKQNEADSRDERAHNVTAKLRSDIEKLVESIRFHEAQRSNRQDEGTNKISTEDDIRLKFLYKKKRAIFTELAVAEAEEKKAFEDNRAIKKGLRRDIIREAEIVVTTLSGCGGDIYSACIELVSQNKNVKSVGDALFDAVVIDEAGQALEPATLIPMQLLKSTGSKCVMVGDPKQLPATVLSQLASKFSYECSMFERLQRADYPVTMLSTQYRMHPEICQFPSAHFYDNQLKDGGPMETKRTALFHENSFLGPYVFYDVVDGYEESGRSIRSQSLCNESEVAVSLEILKFLNLRYPQEFHPERIGIITPYKQQLKELRLQVTNEFGPSIAGKMEFNTVDGFQGREIDMLIFSTVRASSEDKKLSTSESGGIGFVSDVRRMNVALTRAKFSLWIVGNARTLQRSHHWAALVKNAKERKLFFSAKKPYKSMFPNALLGFSAKSCLSSAKPASPRHSHGHQEGKRFKRDNGGKMEESSQLGPKRNMEANSLISLSAKQENRKMHTETSLQNNLGIEAKMSDDALKERRNTHGGKPYRSESHSASRTSNDKSHLIVENGEHQNKLAINKAGLVSKKVKTITDIHCLPEKKNKTFIAQKPKPKANEISKGRTRPLEKREHIMEKERHRTKHVHMDTEANQLNASNMASQRTNTVITPREETLQPNRTVRIPGNSTGEPHGQKEVNSNVGENIRKSSKDDLIALRKRQREAVNSILPSGAFISSKKPNVSQTSSQGRYIGSINDLRNRVGNLPRQGSSYSIGRQSEKSTSQMKQKSQVTCGQKQSSPQRGISDREGMLYEEWERFEKKLAESKAARHPTRD